GPLAERARGLRMAAARPARQLANKGREGPEPGVARVHRAQLSGGRARLLVLPERPSARLRRAGVCAAGTSLRGRRTLRSLRAALCARAILPGRGGLGSRLGAQNGRTSSLPG